MSQQIYRPPVLGNFKPTLRERSKKKPSARDRREGRNEAHLVLIRFLPCCVTGKRGPSDPHHLRSGPAKSERGVGQKATDQWVVPLSRAAHDDAHRVGSRAEQAWFRARGIEDVVELAAALWRVTGDLDAMKRVLRAHMNGGKSDGN